MVVRVADVVVALADVLDLEVLVGDLVAVDRVGAEDAVVIAAGVIAVVDA